jgi:hypothetical protein
MKGIKVFCFLISLTLRNGPEPHCIAIPKTGISKTIKMQRNCGEENMRKAGFPEFEEKKNASGVSPFCYPEVRSIFWCLDS